MNNKRRKKVSGVIEYLQMAYGIVDTVLDEEQECLDNIPENLEGTDMYSKIEDSIDSIEEALDSISSAIDELGSAIE